MPSDQEIIYDIVSSIRIRYDVEITNVVVNEQSIPLSFSGATVLNKHDRQVAFYYYISFYIDNIKMIYFVKHNEDEFDVATMVIRSFIESYEVFKHLDGGEYVLHIKSKDTTLKRLCLNKLGMLDG